MQKRISIAMATFNGEAFIGEQLESFLAQTTMPDELVISDDGSSDSTISVAKTCLEGSSVELLLKQNPNALGYAQNFNTALRLASGDIIFLSDQDDVWMETKINIVKKAFQANPEKYLIIHDLEYCDESLKPIGQTKLERLKSMGAGHRSYVTGMATAIKKEFLDVCLPIPGNPLITHDLWLHECAFALDVKTVINQPLALYRRHGKNVTANKSLNKARRTNFLSFIKRAPLDITKMAVDRKIATSEALIDWLESPRVLDFYTNKLAQNHEHLKIKRSEIKRELSFAKERRCLFDKAVLGRAFFALILYFRGGYKAFLGKKSLLKDILLKT